MRDADERFMAVALSLGDRGLGNVWPNPAVGCVVVNEGRIVGRGWTQQGGRPHAEPEALARAGAAARGATAYVTLEPCAHHGRTAPCAQALIEAGVTRVVIAMVDPDPRVNGRGIAQLRAAGIEVEVGCLAEHAARCHTGFRLRIETRRPLVALKLAQTLDGRIATASGASQWLTGPAARQVAHQLRATHDAIMIGSGTALADDPELTCRLPGLESRSPVRVVVDRRLRLSPSSRLAATAKLAPVWLVTAATETTAWQQALVERGVELVPLPDRAAPPSVVLEALAERGITRVLVEGGSALATVLLRAGLVDHLYLFTAPVLLGGDSHPAVAALELTRLADTRRWQIIDERRLGDDRLTILEPAG